MAISSINFQKQKSHSLEHNFRLEKIEPSYLLPEKFRLNNEYLEIMTKTQIEESFKQQQENKKGGPKAKIENSLWEAVVNLNENHNIEDLKKLAEHIEKEFNISCTSITIHKDEGKVLENGTIHYNFHAHLNFFTFKDNKQNWRLEKITPEKLGELQTKVAEILGMNRGEFNSKTVRLEHKQYKQQRKNLENLHKKAQNAINIVKEKNYDLKKQNEKLEQKTQELYAYGKKMAKYIKELESNLKNLQKQLNNAQNQMQKNQINRNINNKTESIKTIKNTIKPLTPLP